MARQYFERECNESVRARLFVVRETVPFTAQKLNLWTRGSIEIKAKLCSNYV